MDGSILAFDIGSARTGVALARLVSRLPRPLVTLNGSDWQEHAVQLARDNGAVAIVVGLPRNLQGDDTQQTAYVRTMASKLQNLLALPVYFQDEALTSAQAEAELQARGVSYTKEDIDALAATLILEDFLKSSEAKKIVEGQNV